MPATSITVAQAQHELASMRRALASWLRYRGQNDKVLAGTGTTTKPLGYAQAIIAGNRDRGVEQRLASQLALLLSAVYPSATMPDSDLGRNPEAAVQLAQIAVSGTEPAATSPQTVGINWIWPTAIVVGGALLAYTTKIKTDAESAAESERIACIKAGACTDSGFWIKVGALSFLGYVLLKTDVLKDVRKALKD